MIDDQTGGSEAQGGASYSPDFERGVPVPPVPLLKPPLWPIALSGIFFIS